MFVGDMDILYLVWTCFSHNADFFAKACAGARKLLCNLDSGLEGMPGHLQLETGQGEVNAGGGSEGLRPLHSLWYQTVQVP